MATKYCDHGIYAAPVAGGTVPTAAEDGNGSAKTAATMATLVITFTGVPAADEAITIAGVTFTAKASGATGNQFNAATDAATCATNLKNAINASATNAVKPVGAIAATAPLRNVVNACVSGAVVTVYTRCCGSEWNSVTETSTLSNASITAQWSGGGDGAWGYFSNPTSLAFPTAIRMNGYGVYAKDGRPYVGSFDCSTDSVVARSGKTIQHTEDGTHAIGCRTTTWGGVSSATPYTLIIDDGTEWPEDGVTPVLTLGITSSYSLAWLLNGNSSGSCTNLRLLAKKYNDTTYGLSLEQYNPATRVLFFPATSNEIRGVRIYSAGHLSVTPITDVATTTLFADCLFSTPSSALVLSVGDVNGRPSCAIFQECIFANTGNAISNSGFINASAYANNTQAQLWFDSCKFIDFQGSSNLFTGTAGGTSNQIYFRNCEFGNIAYLGPRLAIHGTLDPKYVTASSSQFGTRDFFLDTSSGFISWVYARSMPCSNAKLLDGVTPWVIHMIPSTVNRLSRYYFSETPRIGKICTTASGIKTLTIEFAVETSFDVNTANLTFVVDYIDTDGARQVLDSYERFGSAFTSSSATWTSEAGGQVTYVDGVTRYYDKYKFSITTPTSVKGVDVVDELGTEIGIVMRCHKYATVATQGIFLDPEIQVS